MKGFKGQIARNKPLPSIDKILEKITDAQIFSTYIPGLLFDTSMNSPLGEKDNIPSFNVFWSYRYNKYLFKDFRYGWFGDAFDFVQRLYGFTTLTQTCMQICLDFGIEGFHIDTHMTRNVSAVNSKIISEKKFKRKVKIQITIRDWTQNDIVFWGRYGITTKWLKYARIYPIKYYYINGYIRIADKLAYAYVENKDGVFTYKIYQPYNKYNNKWINNNNRSVWELWEMLPKSHDLLVITKSRKDALSIMATINIPSTSLQAEGTIPKASVVDELKERFKFIILFYDNDFDKPVNYGRLYGQKLSELFGIPWMELPEEYGEKDYSDLVKTHGICKSKRILWYLIKETIIYSKEYDNNKNKSS